MPALCLRDPGFVDPAQAPIRERGQQPLGQAFAFHCREPLRLPGNLECSSGLLTFLMSTSISPSYIENRLLQSSRGFILMTRVE
jgi:hypothetical protein